MKSILKCLRYITRMFESSRKEEEIQIGNPTDVKHVAHIGWEGSSANTATAPTWMNEFNKSGEGSQVEDNSSVTCMPSCGGGSRSKDLPKLPKSSPTKEKSSSDKTKRTSKRKKKTKEPIINGGSSRSTRKSDMSETDTGSV